MTAGRRIRAKIASSISSIEESESFLFIKPLRVVELEHREIEPFTYELCKTDHIPLEIESDGETSDYPISFKRVKNFRLSRRKLEFRSKSNPVFFGFGNVSVSNIKISFDQELSQYFSAKIIEEDASVSLKVKDQKKKEISSKLTSKLITPEEKTTNSQKRINTSKNGPKEVSYLIGKPKVIDCLSQLKPKIYNLELLSRLEQAGLENTVTNTKVELLDRALRIKGFSENDLKLKNGSLYSSFEFSPQIKTKELSLYGKSSTRNSKQVKIKVPAFNLPIITELPVFNDEDSSSYLGKESITETGFGEEINKIIQPNTNLSPDEEQKLFENLSQFQIDGVKILTSNKSVLFANEPGLGKTIQTIIAIKYLLKKRDIKSALIVTDDNLTGDITISENAGSNFGWYGCLRKFAPELNVNIVKSEFNDIISELTKPFQVQIISYRLLVTALRSKNIGKRIFKNFECLVLEDAEFFRDNQNDFVELIKLANPKFNWIITNFEIEGYALNILTSLNQDTFLSHNYENVRSKLPDIIESEFWFDMEKEHQEEFNQTYFHAQNSLQNILETGNPFRFQSQIFYYLHQLNQISNFSSYSIDNNKTRQLLSHIRSLKSFDKRVVVFSQYDKAGIQKIAELLKRENISFKKFSQGMTQDELSGAIAEFESDNHATVFLADSQVMKTKSHLVYAPYIIHFDQWWAPVSRWDLEKKIHKKFNKPITVLNYFTKDAIEKEIRSVLFDKKLLDRETYGNTGADAYSKLLDEDEWIRIFGLEKKIQPPIDKKDDENDSDDI